jgi:tryptophan synthase alpha subunit
VARIADGVIVGSALVRAVAAGAFVAALRAAMDGGRG